jgi:peptide-methionine (S)-S-oxide reductase
MTLVCALPGHSPASFPDPDFDPAPAVDAERAEAVLAGGCFWCTEAVYRQLDGVIEVVSGYSGGSAQTANYEAVCRNTTGHAEAICIVYDPRRISYGQILKVFFSVAHDPTQLNRQGEDIGTQYRSAVFFADPAQREMAERYIGQLDAAGLFASPIVTTLEPLAAFYPAEGYHQNYAALHPDQPFIRAAAQPKVAKLRKTWPEKVRPA